MTKKEYESRIAYLEGEVARLHKTIQELAARGITVIPLPAPVNPAPIPYQPVISPLFHPYQPTWIGDGLLSIRCKTNANLS